MIKFQIIIKELFYVLTMALVVFGFLEIVWRGVVLSYINLNYLLLLWLVNGIILLSINKK